jgi:hypothetical protein
MVTGQITVKPINKANDVTQRTPTGTPSQTKGTPLQTQDPMKNLNPFFTLEKENPTSWAQRTRQKNPTQGQLQQLSQDSRTTTQSPNLLDTSDKDAMDKEGVQSLRMEVRALKATIKGIQAWMSTKDQQMMTIGTDATMARELLQQTNIHKL